MRLFPTLSLLLILLGITVARAADPAPAWQLNNPSGQPVQLSDFKGKVVVLAFWATWCTPCREEIPNLITLQSEYGGAGLQIIGVSEDKMDPKAVQKFVDGRKINYPVVIATKEVISTYHAQALPTLVIIDAQGNIAARHEANDGLIPLEKLEAEIIALLPKEAKKVTFTAEDLRKRLTPEQYAVTQEAATEAPFTNEYVDNHAEGIYVDIVTGQPLFSSTDKFDSGCGWPSFSKPISEDLIVKKEDDSLGMSRTEVRSTQGNSHLGHVFDDGPGPSGLRYCINSASLRFVPKEKLKDEGYGAYLHLFDTPAK